MKLTSPEFKQNKEIPSKFTCDGVNINPPLVIEDIPEDTKQLALIVDDPDSPSGTFVHWLVYEMPVMYRINENSIPGKEGVNDFKKLHYGGPCPGSGTHHYHFKVYALDKEFSLKEGLSKKELENAINGHVIAKSDLVGIYKRKR